MIGTLTVTGKYADRLVRAEDSFAHIKAAGWKTRKELAWMMDKNGYNRHPKRAKLIRGLRRCASLETIFPVVQRDESCCRMVKLGRSETLSVPLIWHTTLPAKHITELTIYRDQSRYSAKAITPMPTTEALSAIREHRAKFDHVELWWVPNDILVEQLPDPDPMVVGAVRVEDGTYAYFELHRWIDESVEVGWWTREGY